MATDMGKYLGVPSIQQRVTTGTYKVVLQRVQQKLQGWKAKCLALATWATLIKVVTSAMPTYVK